jgi:hypothetical protein
MVQNIYTLREPSTFISLDSLYLDSDRERIIFALRSTAAMISYELVLSSAILIVVILSGSLNFTSIIEHQQAI